MTIGVPAVEEHLRRDIVRHVLSPSPSTVIVVDVDGRDVTLRGTVPTDSERIALIARVGARWGVAQVNSRALTVRRTRTRTPSAERVTAPATKRVPAAAMKKPAVAGPATSVAAPGFVVPTTALPLDPIAPTRLQATLASIRRTAPIAFAKSSLTLAASSAAPLDLIAAAINKDRAVVRVEAHTDSSGDNVRNVALSLQRAEVVRVALIARGVAPGLLIAVGRGEVAPIASNITAQGRELNRRIEFVVNPTPTTTPT